MPAALSDESRRRVRAALAVGRHAPPDDTARAAAAILLAARTVVRDARTQRKAVEWGIAQLKRYVDSLPCPPNERAARHKVRARITAAMIRTYYGVARRA